MHPRRPGVLRPVHRFRKRVKKLSKTLYPFVIATPAWGRRGNSFFKSQISVCLAVDKLLGTRASLLAENGLFRHGYRRATFPRGEGYALPFEEGG